MANYGVKRQNLRRPLVGDMRHQIVIVTRTITEPAFGEVDLSETMADAYTVYAHVATKSGDELIDGTNVVRVLNHIFTIRFIAELETQEDGDQVFIRYNDEFYRVTKTEIPDERRQWLIMTATKRGDITENTNRA